MDWTGNEIAVETFAPKKQTVMEKLEILSDAAKYDVSCTSSGVDRRGNGKDMGNSIAADGRKLSVWIRSRRISASMVSRLKVLSDSLRQSVCLAVRMRMAPIQS